MAAKPKAKPSSPARADRTSAVVTTTLILLTALGVVTIFWEPLTALALGSPSTEGVSEPRGATSDDGAAAARGSTATPAGPVNSGAPTGVDASGSS